MKAMCATCLLVVIGMATAAAVTLDSSKFVSAKQSSTGYNGDPLRAIDGNKNTDYAKGSCTHTNDQKHATWYAEMKKTHTVTSVTITNRKDCCSERLRKFEIVVLPQRPNLPLHSTTEATVCARQAETFSGTKTFTCRTPLAGQFVAIRFYDDLAIPLTLCEVEIDVVPDPVFFCHRDNSDCSYHDVAQLKGLTLAQCQAKCADSDSCMSIQFNTKQECYLKNYACTDKELQKNSNGNDYIKVDNLDQCPITFEFCSRDKADCMGHDILQYKGLSREQCQIRCSVTRACRSIHWSTNKDCYLKDFACADFEVMGHESGEYHIRVNDQRECKYLWKIFD